MTRIALLRCNPSYCAHTFGGKSGRGIRRNAAVFYKDGSRVYAYSPATYRQAAGFFKGCSRDPGPLSLRACVVDNLLRLHRCAARYKVERNRVHAIALMCWWRTVVEDMPKVGVATRAQHFDAVHAMRVVVVVRDAVLADRFKETWPAAFAGELRAGPEQLIAADRAVIRSLDVAVPVLSCKRPFGTFFTRHAVEVRWQDLFPGGIRYPEMRRVSIGVVGIVIPCNVWLLTVGADPRDQAKKGGKKKRFHSAYS